MHPHRVCRPALAETYGAGLIHLSILYLDPYLYPKKAQLDSQLAHVHTTIPSPTPVSKAGQEVSVHRAPLHYRESDSKKEHIEPVRYQDLGGPVGFNLLSKQLLSNLC